MSEARLADGVPVTAGWFVVNARDVRWMHNEMRAVCRFGGEGEAHFDDSARYPVEPVAVRHGAGVPDESTPPGEAYARFGEPRPGPAPDIFRRAVIGP